MTAIDTETITEDEAIDVYYKFAKRFGWGGTFFNREDAEERWMQDTGEDALSDDDWDNITSTWYWRKGLQDRLCEEGWELVQLAIDEVLANKTTK
jgi:hypothetical protein